MPCELFYDTSHLLKHPLKIPDNLRELRGMLEEILTGNCQLSTFVKMISSD
ncbi:hypothetical protein RintRC_6908 [Richelia intracellularis]|nr:hypothetical protein RintRC_6908 [Richelia intracellularis]